jgi:hypothetical protein
MMKVLKELEVELVNVKGKNYYMLHFDNNMNIYINPKLVKKNEAGEDVIDFSRFRLKIERTFYKNHFLIEHGEKNQSLTLLVSDRPLEIRLDYEDPDQYYYEFTINGIHYYFIDGGFNWFTFRCEGKLYIINPDCTIREVIEYTPPKKFEVSL